MTIIQGYAKIVHTMQTNGTLRSVVDAFLTPIRHLAFLRNFHNYLDREERRQVSRALIVGSIVWVLAYFITNFIPWLFHALIDWSANHLTLFSFPVFIFIPLIIGALGVAALAKYGSHTIRYRDRDGRSRELVDVEGDGLERAIALFYTSEPSLEQALLGKEGVDARWELPTLSLTLRKMLAMVATLGTGGSGGMGAGVALIGESTAAGLFKPRRLLAGESDTRWGQLKQWWRSTDPDDLETAQLCGIAAGLSTLLGAPLAAAFFAVEIMYRRRPMIEKLVYALIASLTAFFLNRFVAGGSREVLDTDVLLLPPYSWKYYFSVVIMAVCVSIMATYFTRLRESVDAFFYRNVPNVWWRHLLGATGTGAIALLAIMITGWGPELVLGPGDAVINEALNGTLTIWIALVALIAKMFATLSTIGSGGSAGLLFPAIFFGMTIAIIIAKLFHFQASLLVIPSITASVVSLVNVPLTATLLTVELFGSSYLLPTLVSLVVALLFTYETSIYRTQREWDESREILPGYSVRRIAVPRAWAGRTLIELNLRARFDVNVIGMVETEQGNRILPKAPINRPMKVGELLIVLGENEKIDLLQERLQDAQLAES